MSTTPPAVVEAGDFTYESSTSSAAEMIRTLKSDDQKEAPREIKRDGKAVKQPDPVSDAASTLGKKGAEAAAKARKAEAKAKDAPEPAAKPQKAAETKAGEAEGATTDEDEDTYDTPELKARAAETVQRATRTAAEAKREVQRERERAERAERALDEARRAPAREERPAAEAKTPAVDPNKPKFADFLAKSETYDEAIEAYNDARDVYRETQHAQAGRAVERERKVLADLGTFTGRMYKQAESDPEFMERTKDFAKQLQPIATLPKDERGRPIGVAALHVLTEEIIKSELSPGLMDHFTENPEDFERIKSLGSRDDVIRAVSRIEARLEDANAGNPSSDERPGSNPEFSKAKPPARPVAVSPRIANAEPGSDSSLDDHIEFYNARDKEKRRRSA